MSKLKYLGETNESLMLTQGNSYEVHTMPTCRSDKFIALVQIGATKVYDLIRFSYDSIIDFMRDWGVGDE